MGDCDYIHMVVLTQIREKKEKRPCDARARLLLMDMYPDSRRQIPIQKI